VAAGFVTRTRELKQALLELQKDRTLEAAKALLNMDGGAQAGVDVLAEGLEIVGRRFQQGDWFLGELVYAGEIAKQAMELLSPHLRVEEDQQQGRVVVGTVTGDLHDLGKNIFASYARSAGFDVVDLGVDVSAEAFAAAAREHEPVALGVSCLLTSCAGGIPRVIEELASRGLRDAVKVVIGGAALTEEFAEEIGADAFAPDAVTGTDIIRGWSAER
jgi:methylmalonyl-CoA mutase cobalamin-binding domain/chain